MTTKNELEQLISKAWKAHYLGDNASALEQFQRLAQDNPSNIDALWGLGLAFRKAGDLERATQIFSQVQSLVNARLDQSDEEYTRYFMLKRMVDQQLTQIDRFIR